MASKDCKFRSFFECYGHYPLQNRFGVDQIPLELNRRDFTVEEQGTTNPAYIRGPKKDLDKLQATIQGDQIVAPTLIFRNPNPAENRYEMPPGLVNRKVHFDGRTGAESSFYDKRVNVMWQEKAYEEAPLRGVRESVWLQKWSQKYNFPLCKRKAGRWVKKFIKKRCKRRKRLRRKFLWIWLNRIYHVFKNSSFYVFLGNFLKYTWKNRTSTSKVPVPFVANNAVLDYDDFKIMIAYLCIFMAWNALFSTYDKDIDSWDSASDQFDLEALIVDHLDFVETLQSTSQIDSATSQRKSQHLRKPSKLSSRSFASSQDFCVPENSEKSHATANNSDIGDIADAESILDLLQNLVIMYIF